MTRFNFLAHTAQPTELKAKVRVIKTMPDPFAGLKGHDYIKARGLNPQVKRYTRRGQP